MLLETCTYLLTFIYIILYQMWSSEWVWVAKVRRFDTLSFLTLPRRHLLTYFNDFTLKLSPKRGSFHYEQDLNQVFYKLILNKINLKITFFNTESCWGSTFKFWLQGQKKTLICICRIQFVKKGLPDEAGQYPQK